MSPFLPLPPPGCSIIPWAAASSPGAQRRLSALGVPGRVSSELRWSPGGAGPAPIPRPERCKGKPIAYFTPSVPMGGIGLLPAPKRRTNCSGAQESPRSASPACERGRWTGGDQRGLSPASPGPHCQHILKSTFPGLYPSILPPAPSYPPSKAGNKLRYLLQPRPG